jgi:hypothetical protein
MVGRNFTGWFSKVQLLVFLQAKIAVTSPDGHVLPLLFHSDRAELEVDGRKFHPVLMYFGSFRLASIRSRNGFARIVMLPIMSSASLEWTGNARRQAS